jgi:Mn-dependent DtxR family transcriptional regulator
MLERILGLERKERAVQALARLGLMTTQRRGSAQLRRMGRTGVAP